MKRILVLGGTGFVGRHLLEKVGQLGCRVTLPTRRLANAKPVQSLPWVDPVEANIHDAASLVHLVREHDAVVNLVAILHGNQAAFTKVHVDLVHTLVRACQSTGVRRVVHVSALGAAADAPSMYQRSKAEGEAVLAGSGLDVTSLRPSVIFGAGDQFLNLFAKLQTIFPVMPLAGAATRFQPVWVEDVAQAIVNALGMRASVGAARAPSPVSSDPAVSAARDGAVYEACGPDIFTLRELVQLAGRLAGHPRPVLALPMALGRLQALLMELGPGQPLMSRDNLDSMKVDNVASGSLPGLQALGVSPSGLVAIAPSYLQSRAADQILAQRRTAGRF